MCRLSVQRLATVIPSLQVAIDLSFPGFCHVQDLVTRKIVAIRIRLLSKKSVAPWRRYSCMQGRDASNASKVPHGDKLSAVAWGNLGSPK